MASISMKVTEYSMSRYRVSIIAGERDISDSNNRTISTIHRKRVILYMIYNIFYIKSRLMKKVIFVVFSIAYISAAYSQEVLPFPKKKSASKAGVTMQASEYRVTEQEKHLPADAPNILIVLIDDVGYGRMDIKGS